MPQPQSIMSAYAGRSRCRHSLSQPLRGSIFSKAFGTIKNNNNKKKQLIRHRELVPKLPPPPPKKNQTKNKGGKATPTTQAL